MDRALGQGCQALQGTQGPAAGRLQNGALSVMLFSALTAPAPSGGSPCPTSGGQGNWHHQQYRTRVPSTNIYTPSPCIIASGKTFASTLPTRPTPHCPFKIQKPLVPISIFPESHPHCLDPMEVPNLRPGLPCSLVKGRKPSQRKWPYGV